jgi:nucleoside-diphosphate-sugar epimerase
MIFLITGSSGFIGSHLRDELETHGHRAILVDRNRSRREDAAELFGRTFLRDLSDPGEFTDLLAFKPDVVIHLAAQVGREFGEDDIDRTIRWNAVATSFVARACGEAGIPVLYTSSSEVYGDVGPHVSADEYAGPFKIPHNLYGLSKRWGEEALKLYAPDGLMIARLSMPYGPGAPPGRGRRAMDNFLWQAEHRKHIPVHEGATRSWCWVGDTVRALRLIAEAKVGGVWNVGRDDDDRDLVEIAEMACDLAGAPYDLIKIVPAPGRQTVVKRLDTTRLRENFGWRPTVELDEGMAHVYEWIRNFGPDGEWIGAKEADLR